MWMHYRQSLLLLVLRFDFLLFHFIGRLAIVVITHTLFSHGA